MTRGWFRRADAGIPEFDYVIVGAGASGCVLARRLSEQGGSRVLVVEAGGWARDWRTAIPMAWPSLLSSKRLLWRYGDAEAPASMPPLVAGRVVGGSSSVNALAYVRGHRADYDRWAQAGLPDYSYESVLPYFKRQESWEGGADAFRGGDGPIPVIRSRLTDTLLTALLQAARLQGARTDIDYNGADQAGFGLAQLTVANGRRVSSASAYLAPAVAGGFVQVAVRALAERIIIERGRAIGVAYRQGGRSRVAMAGREVLIAAGAVQSPQLLALSGIGDPSALRDLGITARVAAPEVGRNLRNHASVGLAYARRSPGVIHRGLRIDRLTGAAFDWSARGAGFLSTPPNAAMGFVETPRSRGGVPDIQVLLVATTPQAKPYWPLIGHPYADGFMLNAVLLRPESKGFVRLRSADPSDPPSVVQNLLSARHDRDVLADGVRRIDALAHEAPLASIIAGPTGPHPDFTAAPDEFVVRTARPMYHPSGTCRMGASSDPGAVVDPQFRVRGVEQLRVVDASVMPDAIGGNPYACVTMLAEKASDLIRGIN